jgi:hypothetical protein
MPRSAQRNTKNSIQGDLVAFTRNELNIPEHIVVMLDDPEFKARWLDITSCRTPDNWKDWELCEVAEICREKGEIAQLEADVMEEGQVIHFPNGAVSTNPKWKMAQELKKSYMSRIRLIGLHDVKQQARSSGAVAVKDIPSDGADLI